MHIASQRVSMMWLNPAAAEATWLPCQQHGWRWCVHPRARTGRPASASAAVDHGRVGQLPGGVDGGGDAGTLSGPRVDHELTADRRQTVRHVSQPNPHGGAVEPAAGVADREVERLFVGVGRDHDRGRWAAVFGGILQ